MRTFLSARPAHAIRATVLGIAALQIAGCATPTGGLSYSLPHAKATAAVAWTLKRCERVLAPNGTYVGTVVIEPEISIDPDFVADTSSTYRLNMKKIGGMFRDTEFTAKTYPNGTLQMIGSTVEDKTLDIVSSVGKIALGIAGVPSLPVQNAPSTVEASSIQEPFELCTAAAQRVEQAYDLLAAARADQIRLLTASPAPDKDAIEAAQMKVDTLANNYARAMKSATVEHRYPLDLFAPGSQSLDLSSDDWNAWIKPANQAGITNYHALRASTRVQIARVEMTALPGLETDPASVSATAACREPQGCAFVAIPAMARLALRVCQESCQEIAQATSSGPAPLPGNEEIRELVIPSGAAPQFVRLSPEMFNKVSWTLNFDPSGRVPDFKFGETSVAGAAESANDLIRLPQEERVRLMEAEIKRRQLEEKLRQCRDDASKCE